MAAHGSHAPEPLPKVVFSIVSPDALVPSGVINDRVAENYGFNNGLGWEGAERGTIEGKGEQEGRYLRWLQPMESDLARQVEYDMDEQDQIWMDNINTQRRNDGLSVVSYEIFEIIFDKLEKEWFDLTKRIPKKQSQIFNEDSTCAICDDGECENSNAIVFCDGCNLAVHQDCYGVPYIPEGQWLCRKCTVSPDKPVSCVLCPNSYGAFKQTTEAQWAHLLCAIWIPDTGVSNTVYMEPIDGVDNISKNRWKLVCYLCRKKVGACIQCANRNCFQAFHVTCARDRGLELRMKQGGGERGELKAYCEKHSENFTPLDSPALSPQSTPGPSGSNSAPHALLPHHKSGTASDPSRPLLIKLKSSKSARAYKQSYSSGPPLVPAFVFDRVMDYIGKIKFAKKNVFVNAVCRYWSLKREARRGAPLLKRLHLEPWTASATSRHQTDVEKAKKLELIRHLRNDLEKVRMLTERVRKREKKKLERVNLFKSLIDQFIFGKEKIMRDVLARVALLDKQHIFAQPVSRLQAPDYYDIIKHPMNWATMAEKLERHEYLTAMDFQVFSSLRFDYLRSCLTPRLFLTIQDDIELVINNARMYNKRDTVVHKSAIRLRESAEPILAELENLDHPDSVFARHATEALALLTTEYVDNLFEFHYDPPPPKAPTTNATAASSKSGLLKKALAGNSQRKRTAEQAGLTAEDGGKTPVRGSPRTRGAIASGEASATPVGRIKRPRGETKSAAKVEQVEMEVKGSSRKVTKAEHQSVEVTEVDSRSSFKLFESGWVLPEGSSRRGPGTPITVSSTAPTASTSRRAHTDSAIVPTPSRPSSRLSRAVATATPASTSRKGKERAVEDVEEKKHNRDQTDDVGVKQDWKKEFEDLKNMSFDNAKKEWREKLAALNPLVQVTEETVLEDGTLVWAKLPGFPCFPAEVADPDLDSTPQTLVKQKPGGAHADSLVLVMFFDDRRSGGWCHRSDLRLLGENAQVDQLLQSPIGLKASVKKSKGKKPLAEQVEEITDAYTWAISMEEIPSDLVVTKKTRKSKKAA